jgi:hypothetical protein
VLVCHTGTHLPSKIPELDHEISKLLLPFLFCQMASFFCASHPPTSHEDFCKKTTRMRKCANSLCNFSNVNISKSYGMNECWNWPYYFHYLHRKLCQLHIMHMYSIDIDCEYILAPLFCVDFSNSGTKSLTLTVSDNGHFDTGDRLIFSVARATPSIPGMASSLVCCFMSHWHFLPCGARTILCCGIGQC